MTRQSVNAVMSYFQPRLGREEYVSYLDYKDSGVEWLGEIPVHWGVKRLKSIADVQVSNVDKKTVDGQIAVRLCNYVDVYYNEKIHSGIQFMGATATPEQVGRFLLRAGDVLITKDLEDWADIAVPSVVTQDFSDVLCGYHLAHIRPGQNCEGSFLGRAFASIGLRGQYHVAANGITRFGLTNSVLREGILAIPPLSEQCSIAAFLDRETTRIDMLVEKQERLIDLLQERRVAFISHAVTKGLDPDIPMKDSGVEWLGEIPVHWEVKRLKSIADVQVSNVDKKTVDGQIAVRLCNYVDVYYNEKIHSGIQFMGATATPEQVGRFLLRAGDVLITKDSEDWADIAVPSVVTQDFSDVLCGYHLAHIRPGQNCEGSFLGRAFASIGLRGQYHVAANGITRFGLTNSVLREGIFAIPPLSEQRTIAAFLDRETVKIDNLIAKIHQAIKLQKEFRSALISAVVTGKMDVRGSSIS